MTTTSKTQAAHRYSVTIDKDGSLVEMPKDAIVLKLSAASKPGMVNVWAMVDPQAETVIRTFVCVVTGQEFDGSSEMDYVGSITMRVGKAVASVHCFLAAPVVIPDAMPIDEVA